MFVENISYTDRVSDNLVRIRKIFNGSDGFTFLWFACKYAINSSPRFSHISQESQKVLNGIVGTDFKMQIARNDH